MAVHSRTILVASFDEYPDRAATLTALICESWPSGRHCYWKTTTVESLDPGQLRDIDVLVLDALGAPDLRPIAHFTREIEEFGVPSIVIVPPDCANGSILELLTASSDELPRVVALLEGLLHRQDEVSLLRQELQIAQRSQGGIHGEITRIHEELQLAAMMQREFLPGAIPNVHGVEFAAMWQPAHYVSGDIYNVIALDEDHVGIFLADCVGHGVPAALMTMLICRSVASAIATPTSGQFTEPAHVLSRINDDLVRRQSHSTRFCTAVYGIIDCRTRNVRLATGGHPPPLVIKEGQLPRELETNGSLLGIFDGAEFEQIELQLEDDERLILYSDGFEQAFPQASAGEYERRIPTDRYREEFLALSDEPNSDAMIERMRSRINDQSGSLHQADDLTLLCVRATQVEQPQVLKPVARAT